MSVMSVIRHPHPHGSFSLKKQSFPDHKACARVWKGGLWIEMLNHGHHGHHWTLTLQTTKTGASQFAKRTRKIN